MELELTKKDQSLKEEKKDYEQRIENLEKRLKVYEDREK
jgi:hypothetical protein